MGKPAPERKVKIPSRITRAFCQDVLLFGEGKFDLDEIIAEYKYQRVSLEARWFPTRWKFIITVVYIPEENAFKAHGVVGEEEGIRSTTAIYNRMLPDNMNVFPDRTLFKKRSESWRAS